MKPYTMTVSPDFMPDYIAGWYIFNTWLQRQLGQSIHLELYNDFATQREAISRDEIDLIYANPFDAAMLVREKGFSAIAAPQDKPDEVILAVPAESPVKKLDDLTPGTRIARTDDPDVNLIGMMMIESADLKADNTHVQMLDSYVLVAKALFQERADLGFFLKEAYESLSDFVRSQLSVLLSSEIHVVTHVLLASPAFTTHQDELRACLLDMPHRDKGQGVLDSMGLSGWQLQAQEDTEFMIDLMDTLA
ncbi:phosphate/phosphite/phosphonate ABC transporter substrate-binding protein [Leucothrix pacifica]|uniref:Phosphate ABC transporter substrate-binding protein n=1 Tax=Leucothrix pacifica TaxID=1247513 RepID=A0A317CLK0_9GAMM|nr:phosphate/phosphite/phosphonate ABC transporter substrate-binding protein [Leucothrix pacifica]PWQ97182.1 phosphate ABC transporter substrate-binding protein [Leucothrix pacifica]